MKLDELIRVTKGARIALLNLEEMEEAELDQIRDGYARLAGRARSDPKQSRGSSEMPDSI
jgi:low affinity Fe/Cu permease